jgi:hypothetical protein
MTKLCPRGKAAAKRKFAVYPSAYANAYASKICAGKIKDPSGVKRKDFKGPKKAALGAIIGLGAAAMGKKFLKKKGSKMLGMDGVKPGETVAELYKKKMKGTQGPIRTMNKGGGLDMGGPRGRIMQRLKDKDKLTIRDKEFLKAEKSGNNKTIKDIRTEARAYAYAQSKKNKGRMTEKDIETATSIIKKKAKPFNKGGLKAELNNPAKGYTAGGMADYYKDLM